MFCDFDGAVICNEKHNLSMVVPCNQDEGDARAALHAKDKVRYGHSFGKVYNVDTDVMVIELAMFQMIPCLQELLEIGNEKAKQFYAIHKFNQKLGAYSP